MRNANVVVCIFILVMVAIFNLSVPSSEAADADSRWGLLANEGFEQHHIKATAVFSPVGHLASE